MHCEIATVLNGFGFDLSQCVSIILFFTLIYKTGLLLIYRISGSLFLLSLGSVFSAWPFRGYGY